MLEKVLEYDKVDKNKEKLYRWIIILWTTQLANTLVFGELYPMMKKVYIDTSVVGGYFDDEFHLWTKIFFESVKKSEFRIVVSELLTEELKYAPEYIRDFLDDFPNQHKEFVELTEEAETLALQ